MARNDDENPLTLLQGVAARMREVRLRRGHTLTELADRIGISLSTLSRLESGQRRPTLDLLLPLAQIFEVTLDDLVGRPPPDDPRQCCGCCFRLRGAARPPTRALLLVPQRASGVGHGWRVDRFLEFLRTGTIDGLGIGASAADVRQKLGPPDDASAIKPPIWKYEQTEITFCDGYVVMITVRAHADAEAVTKMLDDAGVVYEPHSALTYGDQIAYVVGSSGVTLTLDATQPVARGFAS